MGRSSLDFPASVEYRLIDCRTGNSIISRRPNIIKRECPGAFLQLDRECWRGQRTRPAPPRSPWYLLGLALEALKGGTSTSTSTGCSPVSTAEPRLRVCGVHAHQFQAASGNSFNHLDGTDGCAIVQCQTDYYDTRPSISRRPRISPPPS